MTIMNPLGAQSPESASPSFGERRGRREGGRGSNGRPGAARVDRLRADLVPASGPGNVGPSRPRSESGPRDFSLLFLSLLPSQTPEWGGGGGCGLGIGGWGGPCLRRACCWGEAKHRRLDRTRAQHRSRRVRGGPTPRSRGRTRPRRPPRASLSLPRRPRAPRAQNPLAAPAPSPAGSRKRRDRNGRTRTPPASIETAARAARAPKTYFTTTLTPLASPASSTVRRTARPERGP